MLSELLRILRKKLVSMSSTSLLRAARVKVCLWGGSGGSKRGRECYSCSRKEGP